MQITLNGAGGSAADPILKGLLHDLVFFSTSMDVAAINDSFIDTATGFPGSNTVKANLSPTATVITGGTTGGYNDTTKQWTLSSTTGKSVGDYIYLAHSLITDGIYKIANVVDGADITVDGNPLDGQGNQSNVDYQIAWRWRGGAGSVGSGSDASGVNNFFKIDAEDGGGAGTQREDSGYVRDAPVGAGFIGLAGGDYTGQTLGSFTIPLAVLSAWANSGGVKHLELANHSGQGVNNFTWTTGGGTGEKTIADGEGGLQASAGDGIKYGRLLLKGATASATPVGVDISITVDTAGPVMSIALLAA
ncbi:MAG: hypothetical protein JKX92_05385 [Porticoccaceae bacterium]|nr:hypothetical protein [Porticoccaceae bacterium]